MGLFNFFYKLTNILSNKRKIKVFVIIAIIILILFCWSRGAFASTPTDDIAIQNYQLTLQESFITYMYWLNTGAFGGFDRTAFDTIVNRLRYCQVYVTIPVGDPNCNFLVYFYNLNSNGNNPQLFNTTGTYSVGLNSGTQIDCMLGNISCVGFARIVMTGNNRTTPIFGSDTSVLMPSACYGVRSTRINDFLRDMGFISELPTTYSTHDAELQAVTQSGFTNEVNAINNATSAINDVNSSVEDVNESVMEMIETIVDPYVNVSQQQLPTEEVNDTTQEPLNTLFDYIKDAFTGEPQAFSFPLPFVRW